ncbi:MAG: o-succinylbenzoate synthase [Bacteroidales bacterium]
MLNASYTQYLLHFKRPAGTSRGVLRSKPAWFLELERPDGKTGIGEVSMIPGLSRETPSEVEASLHRLCGLINDGHPEPLSLELQPGIRFAMETALQDLEGGGKRLLFPSPFTDGKQGIPINGLIWMGDPAFMKAQIIEKLEQGFGVLKMKVGALEPGLERGVLEWIRSTFGNRELELRLDANGAWSPQEALQKMEQFAPFGIHSLEQPIAPGQWEEMGRLCRNAPFPLALDEELIGLDPERDGTRLMEKVRPQYLILKPGLLGGFKTCNHWIRLACAAETTGGGGPGWWVTSALESSVGLNAIAQWTFQQSNAMVQGLGTGSIYSNNLPSPLQTEGSLLWYREEKGWDLSVLHDQSLH